MKQTIATLAVVVLLITTAQAQQILQDSRQLPGTDGSFGFLYRTEDGIAHGAKSDPSSGVVSGRFTYSDPTGFKLNYNYATASVPKRQSQQQAYQPQAVTSGITEAQFISDSQNENGIRNVPDYDEIY